MKYLSWEEKTIDDFSDSNIESMYEQGFVFTRVGKGVMNKTRSIRIDLSRFVASSENRRVLKKTGEVTATSTALPLREYDWSLGKLAKDFYETKFGQGIMSAQKIKEMLTSSQSNFNKLLIYSGIGYCICYESARIIHYSYPFYDLQKASKDMGLGMMIRAIQLAKDEGKKYIYLGSLQRKSDTYKLQFEGLEWFDGEKWSDDIDAVKEILGGVTSL